MLWMKRNRDAILGLTVFGTVLGFVVVALVLGLFREDLAVDRTSVTPGNPGASAFDADYANNLAGFAGLLFFVGASWLAWKVGVHSWEYAKKQSEVENENVASTSPSSRSYKTKPLRTKTLSVGRANRVKHSDKTGKYREEGLIYPTSSGEWVRSRSEVVIYEVLARSGLSFKYEKTLVSRYYPKTTKLPDFTIMLNGEEFYWEHLGMLSDPIYEREWKIKLEWYKDHDYVDRLITSRNGPNGVIDESEVERIVFDKILSRIG